MSRHASFPARAQDVDTVIYDAGRVDAMAMIPGRSAIMAKRARRNNLLKGGKSPLGATTYSSPYPLTFF
jgi:hypothetical protein